MSQSPANQRLDNAKDDMHQAAGHAREAVGNAAQGIQNSAQQNAEGFKQAAHNTAQNVQDKAGELGNRAQQEWNDVKQGAHEVSKSVQDKAGEMKDQASKKMEEGKHAAQEKVDQAKDHVNKNVDSTANNAHAAVEKGRQATEGQQHGSAQPGEEDKSYIQQAKDGAAAVATTIGTGIGSAVEGVKNLAHAGYEKVGGLAGAATDSGAHGQHQNAAPHAETGDHPSS